MISKNAESRMPDGDKPSQKTNNVLGNFQLPLSCKSKSMEPSQNEPPTESRSIKLKATKNMVTILLFNFRLQVLGYRS